MNGVSMTSQFPGSATFYTITSAAKGYIIWPKFIYDEAEVQRRKYHRVVTVTKRQQTHKTKTTSTIITTTTEGRQTNILNITPTK